MSLESIHLDHLLSVSKGKKERESNGNSHSSRYIQIEDLRDDRNVKYCSPSTKSVYAEEKDILIAWDGANAGTIGYNLSGAVGSTIARLRLKIDSVHTPYVGRFLQSRFREIRDNCTGATIPHVSGKHLKSMKVPLPPLQEQKRIAAILDQADALREKRRTAIAKLDELLQSVFLDMFGDPVANAGWQHMTVESLASSRKGAIRTGPFGSQLLHSEFVDSGVAVLGIDNAVKNTFTWDQRRYITEDKYQQLKRYKVFPGDILITIMGTCGRCSIVPDDISEAINTKHLCCITLNQDLCIPEYLHSSFLMHREVLHQLGVSKKGAVMPGLNMQIIKNLKIPVAPLAFQKRYKTIVQEISSRKASLINHEMKLNTLFSSLQRRVFRGEL